MNYRNDITVSIQIKFYLSALYLTWTDSFLKAVKNLNTYILHARCWLFEYCKEHDYGEQLYNVEDIFLLKQASVQGALLIYSSPSLDFIAFKLYLQSAYFIVNTVSITKGYLRSKN